MFGRLVPPKEDTMLGAVGPIILTVSSKSGFAIGNPLRRAALVRGDFPESSHLTMEKGRVGTEVRGGPAPGNGGLAGRAGIRGRRERRRGRCGRGERNNGVPGGLKCGHEVPQGSPFVCPWAFYDVTECLWARPPSLGETLDLDPFLGVKPAQARRESNANSGV